MNRSLWAAGAVVTIVMSFLTACSLGPASKQEVCDQFTELGRQVATANGLIDNLVFYTAGVLADTAKRYSGPESLSPDSEMLAEISDSSSTSSYELMTATAHIADLCGHALGLDTLFDLGPGQNSGAGPGTRTAVEPTQRPATPEYTPPTDTTATPQPAEYRRVTGPAGLSVDLPRAFEVTSAPSAANHQAADPASPAVFVRFGGSAAPKSTLLAEIEAGERTNPNIRSGYRRIQLSTVTFRGTTAVDWEFTFVKDGIARHAYGRYWRAGRTGYVVYASAPVEQWQLIQPVFEHMLESVAH
jgi:hypothetical protein